MRETSASELLMKHREPLQLHQNRSFHPAPRRAWSPKLDGVDWITALKSGAIANLSDAGHLQFDLFDERNFISPTHDDYPGERLVACRNPALAKLSAESAMT